MKSNQSMCVDCGMMVTPGEFHPFGACLMFKGCSDGDQVRTNLQAIRDQPALQDADKVVARPAAYILNPKIINPDTGEFIGFAMDRLHSAELTVLDMLRRETLTLLIPAQPDPAMAGDDREVFEEWHRNKFRTKHDSGQPTRDMHNGVYDDEYGPAHQQQMWEAWQASNKRAQPANEENKDQ